MNRFLEDKFHVSELEARSRLGKFGLGGPSALLPMRSLSGGQKTRVSLTAITWDGPHLLVLDEPTNHLDTNALDALAAALRAFEGGVVLVSHNRAFCAAFCKELWVVEKGGVRMMRGEGEDSFPELFSAYTSSVMSRIGGAGGAGRGDAGRRSRQHHRAAALDRDKGRGNRKKQMSGVNRSALM